MNEIRYPKVLVVLCCLALHIATLSAQNDSVRFFNEVDTSFCKVHVGQDVRVGYYSTGEIYDMSVPRWDDCEAELVSGPHSTRSSRTSFVNGKQENLSLHGNYYIVRFKKAGWVTLPSVRAMTGAVISRHKHDEVISIPTAQTILHEDDYIQAVGSEEALNQLSVLVGEREEGELPLVDTQEIESLLLTKKDMINKQLGDLNLMKNFGCTVTRVRRSGIDLSPSPDLTLKFGDKLMVVGEKEGLKGLARLLGNNAKKLSDTDFFPIAMGIVLGVLFGKLNITFPGGLSFSPGLTGGILIVALFLSAIGKTGPILWSMSGPANQLLRQLGLLLFLAEVGTSAGTNLVATFQESGWLLFGVGAAITLVPMLVAVFVGLFVFKISILDLLGTITGGMTSTPGLAAADSMTDSNIPSVAYATVYPIAMVFLILFIQIIATMV